MSPRTNGKRENSIYYTWQIFFKATRQKGRSKTDFFLSLKIFFFYWWTFFEIDRWALEPTASVEILYTTLEKHFLRQRDKRADLTAIFTKFSFTKPCRIASAFFHKTQKKRTCRSQVQGPQSLLNLFEPLCFSLFIRKATKEPVERLLFYQIYLLVCERDILLFL